MFLLILNVVSLCLQVSFTNIQRTAAKALNIMGRIEKNKIFA